MTWRSRGGKIAAVLMIGLGVWMGFQAWGAGAGEVADCGCGGVEHLVGH